MHLNRRSPTWSTDYTRKLFAISRVEHSTSTGYHDILSERFSSGHNCETNKIKDYFDHAMRVSFAAQSVTQPTCTHMTCPVDRHKFGCADKQGGHIRKEKSQTNPSSRRRCRRHCSLAHPCASSDAPLESHLGQRGLC